MQEKVLTFIETIRNSFDGSVTVYTRGSCYWFFLILKQVFPEAQAFFDMNHVITKIGDGYYDITGEVQKVDHLPFTEVEESVKIQRGWKFSIFHDLLSSEKEGHVYCPTCDGISKFTIMHKSLKNINGQATDSTAAENMKHQFTGFPRVGETIECKVSVIRQSGASDNYFFQGEKYKCESYGCVTDENGNKEHRISKIDWLNAHFKKIEFNGVELIAVERQEQIEKHGFDLQHDSGHVDGTIAVVAATLATLHTDAVVRDPLDRQKSWGLESKCQGNTIKALTVAGALIAAEIDRLKSIQ